MMSERYRLAMAVGLTVTVAGLASSVLVMLLLKERRASRQRHLINNLSRFHRPKARMTHRKIARMRLPCRILYRLANRT